MLNSYIKLWVRRTLSRIAHAGVKHRRTILGAAGYVLTTSLFFIFASVVNQLVSYAVLVIGIMIPLVSKFIFDRGLIEFFSKASLIFELDSNKSGPKLSQSVSDSVARRDIIQVGGNYNSVHPVELRPILNIKIEYFHYNRAFNQVEGSFRIGNIGAGRTTVHRFSIISENGEKLHSYEKNIIMEPGDSKEQDFKLNIHGGKLGQSSANEVLEKGLVIRLEFPHGTLDSEKTYIS